jgi:hypothetical protein
MEQGDVCEPYSLSLAIVPEERLHLLPGAWIHHRHLLA